MEKTSQPQYIGIDVGGTKILGVGADPTSGTVHRSVRVATPHTDMEGLLNAIAGIVDDLLTDRPAAAIGVGMPGLVDRSGVLRYGPNVPGILDFDVGAELRNRFGLLVAVENDASNAALAEHRLGAARGAMHAVIVTQGTGIGGALVVDGKLLRGANGFAGEPGHMLVDQGGIECACGRLGCWESVASGTGLANLARQLLAEGRGDRVLELAGGRIECVRGEHVSAAWKEGDVDAIEIRDRFASWVAAGLGSLITLLDPEIVVLGGGLAAINQSFIADVENRVMDLAMGGGYRPRVPVVPAQMGEAAGAIGAAINASDLLRGH
ncbi:MAG: glucokinase [Acidimicrobiales bacterium]